MQWSAETVVPRARSEGLVVERMGDETLVYDTDRDEAHHLNPTAATVFELCDGRATVRELAAVTAERLGQPVGRETVGDALALLAECELLCPGSVQGAGVSRRQVVRQAALAGAAAVAAAPVIKSIVAPTPAQAQTGCTQNGGVCDVASECCSGLVCCFPSCQSTQTICTAPGSCVFC